MVSGKIFGFSVSIIVLIISIAVVIRFGSGLKIGERFNDGLQGLSGSVNSFFDSLLPQANASSLRVADLKDPFFKDDGVSKGSPQNAISQLDPNDPNFEQNKIEVLESFGITGADSVTVLPSGGLSISQGGIDKPQDDFFKPFLDAFGNVFTVPVVFAEEPVKVNSQPQNKIPKSNPTSSGQQSINVKGEVKGVKINEGFSADGSIVGAIIRPTPIDRTNLLTDENKTPIETASQRANRVFEETGDFADVKRGATSISKTSQSNFDFGTNTGSGQKGHTESATQESRIERLAREAEKARQVFDGGAISNF